MARTVLIKGKLKLKKQNRNTRNVLRILSVLSLSLLISSCGQVVIKNSEWCGDMGELGASCFNTLNDDSRDLEKEAWDAERFGQVCTQPENFAAIKTTIEKLCYKNKKCTYQQKKILKRLGRNLEKFNKEANDFATESLAP
jgi:hypothetical protein